MAISRQRQEQIKHPERHYARTIIYNLVKQGKIKRLPCEVCSKEKSEAHHPDYSKPLEVRWLCKKHHKELDRK